MHLHALACPHAYGVHTQKVSMHAHLVSHGQVSNALQKKKKPNRNCSDVQVLAKAGQDNSAAGGEFSALRRRTVEAAYCTCEAPNAADSEQPPAQTPSGDEILDSAAVRSHNQPPPAGTGTETSHPRHTAAAMATGHSAMCRTRTHHMHAQLRTTNIYYSCDRPISDTLRWGRPSVDQPCGDNTVTLQPPAASAGAR